MKPLRVALDARLATGEAGGVESVVIGLASGLSSLVDGDEEYVFLTYAGEDEWIRSYLRGPCSPLVVGRRPRDPWYLPLRRRLPEGLRGSVRRRLGRRDVPPVPESDGTVERAAVDLMHFTFQGGFMTTVPSIYQPHDLQHLHLPENFDPGERRRRETWYRALCAQARLVVVGTTWTQRDIVERYHLEPRDVAVIPLAPVVSAYPERNAEDRARTRLSYGLPDAFILYPAQTWPHKNHLGLLDALAELKSRQGLVVPLVCTGSQTQHFAAIARRALDLGLAETVYFLGFVPPAEMRDLYGLARAVVIPTLFESASAPLWEAFEMGIPAACSNVTALPAQAGDAAIVFDPRDVSQIAASVRRLWSDEPLRATLAERGKERVSAFTWDRTARHFRAQYRRLAGRQLDDEDVALLASAPLL